MQIIICDDNRKVLKGFKNNSFDAIVTDPPYELGFMGKHWDASGLDATTETNTFRQSSV